MNVEGFGLRQTAESATAPPRPGSLIRCTVVCTPPRASSKLSYLSGPKAAEIMMSGCHPQEIKLHGTLGVRLRKNVHQKLSIAAILSLGAGSGSLNFEHELSPASTI